MVYHWSPVKLLYFNYVLRLEFSNVDNNGQLLKNGYLTEANHMFYLFTCQAVIFRQNKDTLDWYPCSYGRNKNVVLWRPLAPVARKQWSRGWNTKTWFTSHSWMQMYTSLHIITYLYWIINIVKLRLCVCKSVRISQVFINLCLWNIAHGRILLPIV